VPNLQRTVRANEASQEAPQGPTRNGDGSEGNKMSVLEEGLVNHQSSEVPKEK